MDYKRILGGVLDITEYVIKKRLGRIKPKQAAHALMLKGMELFQKYLYELWI